MTMINALVQDQTSDKMRQAWEDHCKKNKWIPYQSWLGSQLDTIFN